MMTGDPIDMPRTMWGVFMWLDGRFIVPRASIPVHDPERGVDAMKALDAFYEETRLHRSEIPYDIDGLVVSVNDLQLLEELGDLNMRPRGQVAWKFEHPTGETRVLGVRWQVGTTGRVVPVASVEPVLIGGVTITSVSLHNLGMFRSLKLRKGSRVLVSRRNEVIPYVERNLDEDVNPAEMERIG
jgi:DNA ligase (NAD+)